MIVLVSKNKLHYDKIEPLKKPCLVPVLHGISPSDCYKEKLFLTLKSNLIKVEFFPVILKLLVLELETGMLRRNF